MKSAGPLICCMNLHYEKGMLVAFFVIKNEGIKYLTLRTPCSNNYGTTTGWELNLISPWSHGAKLFKPIPIGPITDTVLSCSLSGSDMVNRGAHSFKTRTFSICSRSAHIPACHACGSIQLLVPPLGNYRWISNILNVFVCISLFTGAVYLPRRGSHDQKQYLVTGES